MKYALYFSIFICLIFIFSLTTSSEGYPTAALIANLLALILFLPASLRLLPKNKIIRLLIILLIMLITLGLLLKWNFYVIAILYDSQLLSEIVDSKYLNLASDSDVMLTAILSIISISIALLMSQFTYKYAFEKNVNYRMQHTSTKNSVTPANIRDMVLIALSLFIISSIIRWKYSLHVPGHSAELPWKIEGVVNLSNTLLVHSLFTLILYFCVSGAVTLRTTRLVSYLFIISGVVSYFLFYSKFSIIYPYVVILSVSYLFGKIVISKKETYGFFAVVVLIYPFLNFYRGAKINGTDYLSTSHFVSQLMANRDLHSIADVIFHSVGLLWGRLVGFESLLLLIANYDGWTGFDFIFGRPIGDIIVRDILGLYFSIGIAPGFLGQSYYISGSLVVVFFISYFWFLFTFIFLDLLTRKGSAIFQAIGVLLALKMFHWTMGGLKFSEVVFTLFTISSLPFVFKLLAKSK